MNMKTIFAYLFLLVAAVTSLRAQVPPQLVTTLALSGSTVSASTTTAVTSGSFTVNGNTGFAIMPTFSLAASGTTNVTFNFQASADGTTWSTNYPFSAVIAATGTTAVVSYYNFPAALSGTGCANVRYVRLGQVINSGTSTLTISGVTVMRSSK